MREVEPVVTVLMNPRDAADHPDGTFGGHPIAPDPGMPEGWARFKAELPPDVAAQPPKICCAGPVFAQRTTAQMTPLRHARPA